MAELVTEERESFGGVAEHVAPGGTNFVHGFVEQCERAIAMRVPRSSGVTGCVCSGVKPAAGSAFHASWSSAS